MNHYGKFFLLAVIVLGLVGTAILLKPQSSPKAGTFSVSVSGGGAYPRQSLTQATTTPCALGPQSATTSIEHFAITITTATSSAGTFVLGTTTTPYSTSTTPIATFTVPANTQYTYTWNGGVNNDVVSPGLYVVAGMTTASAVNYGYSYGGTCSITQIAD